MLIAFTLAWLSMSAEPATQTCAIEAADWAPRGTTHVARPRITVTFSSSCGVPLDTSSIRMMVDDSAATPTIEGSPAKVTVTYVPTSSLVEEEHTVAVQIFDQKGMKGEKTWVFEVADSYQR